MTTVKQGAQLIKTRDDSRPVRLDAASDSDGGEVLLRLSDDRGCSWAKVDEAFGPKELRPRIEPWLTALVQSEHLSLLVGSGLTHAVHWLATGQVLPGMDAVTFNTFEKEIEVEANRAAQAAGRGNGNFEDQIRAASELLRGLEIMASDKASDGAEWDRVFALRAELTAALQSFARAILKGEQDLRQAAGERRERALNYLVSFLLSFASRSGTRDRLHLFTTNYDRYIEAAADMAGLRLIDRFVGALAPVFRASRLDIDLHYNPPGMRGEPRYLEGVARFTKLHGSVDWVDCSRMIRRVGLPFGASDPQPYLSAEGLENANAMGLMIYPNAAKDRETALYPYVELFRDLAAAICRPNSTLVTYGYGFGDEHINRVIEDMLSIPSTHLVVIAYGDPLGRIMRMYERLGRQAQMTILLGNHLGDLQALVDHYLPKPAIDRTTFRMADLLRARWSTDQAQDHADGASADGDGGAGR